MSTGSGRGRRVPVCAYESGVGRAFQDVLRLRITPCFDRPPRPAPDGVADVLGACLNTFGEAAIGRMQDGEALPWRFCGP